MEHLFFKCGFSKRISMEVLKKCLVEDPNTVWEEVMEWGVTELKGKKCQDNLCKLALGGGSISHIEAKALHKAL